LTGARKCTGLGYLSVTRHSDQATTYRALSAVARVVIHFLLCSRCLLSSACLLRSPILPSRCCINHSKRPHEEFDKMRKPKRSVNSSLTYLELNMHNNNPRTRGKGGTQSHSGSEPYPLWAPNRSLNCNCALRTNLPCAHGRSQ